MKSFGFWRTRARQVMMGIMLVVAMLAVARGLNGGNVPPEYVTAPLIVVGAAAAVALDVVILRRLRSRSAGR